MKNSCIAHPENEPLIIIREWQLEFCDGDKVAAALMSFFEYWHNIKLEMSAKNKKLIEVATAHGETITVDVSLYQWHTHEDLMNGIIKLATSKTTINKALDTLVEKGVISVHRNPNPKFKFDQTRYFIFYPEVCKQYLEHRSSKNERREDTNGRPSSKSEPTITETTTETPTEIYTPAVSGNEPPPVRDFLSDVVAHKPGSEGIANPAQDFAAHFGYRDQALAAYQELTGLYPDLKVGKPAIIELSEQPGFDLERWQRSIKTAILGGAKKNNIQCFIDTYKVGGNYPDLFKPKEAEAKSSVLTPEQKEAARRLDAGNFNLPPIDSKRKRGLTPNGTTIPYPRRVRST